MGEEGVKKAVMEVHGNEYHDPDFEQEGAAASLVEAHRTTATHTQNQPPAEHGNEKHNPDFEQQGVAASLVGTHEAKTTGIHGVGGSTVESAAGAQGKVDTHEAKTTGIHGVGGSTVESAAGAQSKVDTHEAKTTGVHGVGADYVCGAKSSGVKARGFVKGWTLNTLLKGGGVDADPTEISGWEKIAEVVPGSNVTYVDFTSLDINTDKFYELFMAVVNTAGGAIHLQIFANGDTTPTNYYNQYFIADGAGLYATHDNTSRMTWMTTEERTQVRATVSRDPSGYFKYISHSVPREGAAARIDDRYGSKVATITNLTSLRIQADIANGIGQNSILLLCKPRTS
jgi:hypothetical protein